MTTTIEQEITIDEEFKVLLPPLPAEDYAQLEQNIIKDGCHDPLKTWQGILIDGHHRHAICTRHGIPYKTVPIALESRAHVKVWMIDNQRGRRNMTPAWAIEMELAKKEQLLVIGREKYTETVGRPARKSLSPSDNDLASGKSKHNTRQSIAKAAGTSTGQVGMAEQVKKKDPELWEKAKAGDVSIKEAYNTVKKTEKIAEREAEIEAQRQAIESGEAKLPEGEFEVVVMDPPWAYGRKYDPETSRAANPYPEMSQADLLQLTPPCGNDAVLFMWTTHQFIWDAKELLDKWGFVYKAAIVWDKGKMGMGHWLRMQCEFCLVGIRGKPTWANTKYRDIIREPRREHSRKPEAFYEMVEDITTGRRVEFFAREQRKGWSTYGNDTEKFQ
jgi:N6-adenosine-specific RNA methylase IME4